MAPARESRRVPAEPSCSPLGRCNWCPVLWPLARCPPDCAEGRESPPLSSAECATAVLATRPQLAHFVALALAQRVAAERLLLQFQEHPQAWQRVDVILTSAQSQATKYFALQVSTAARLARVNTALRRCVSRAGASATFATRGKEQEQQQQQQELRGLARVARLLRARRAARPSAWRTCTRTSSCHGRH